MSNAHGNDAQFQQAVHLHNLLAIVSKRKRLIIWLFIIVVGTATIASFLMSSVYRASAKVIVEREIDSEKALLFRMDFRSRYEGYEWVNSEIEIAKSHAVAARVVKAMRLDKTGAEGETASGADTLKHFEKAVQEFQDELNIENIRKSNVLDISYEAGDPQLAAAIVNKVIETYTGYRSEIYDESKSYKFFEEQIRIADEKLRELENRQAEFKQQKEILSPVEQRAILLAKLADYEKSLTTVRTQRIGKEATLAVIQERLQNGQDINIPSTESSDSPSREKHIARLRGELLDMEIQRERLLQKFTPKYEEVVDLEQQIAATKSKIGTEIQQIADMEATFIRGLKAEEGELQQMIDKITREIKEFTRNEFEYSQLSRGIDDNREVYSMLLKQREEARISLAKLERGVRVRIISPAVAYAEPVKPRKMLIITIAAFLGLVSSLGIALLVEFFERAIGAPDELEQLAGMPLREL